MKTPEQWAAMLDDPNYTPTKAEELADVYFKRTDNKWLVLKEDFDLALSGFYGGSAREAQHKATWELAMSYVDSQLSKKFVGCRTYQVIGYFPEQDCPLLEQGK
jgi:hypothetical protein